MRTLTTEEIREPHQCRKTVEKLRKTPVVHASRNRDRWWAHIMFRSYFTYRITVASEIYPYAYSKVCLFLRVIVCVVVGQACVEKFRITINKFVKNLIHIHYKKRSFINSV